MTPIFTAACSAEQRNHPGAEEQTEAILRMERDHHSADDNKDEQKHDEQADAQAQFLADHGKDEIGVRVTAGRASSAGHCRARGLPCRRCPTRSAPASAAGRRPPCTFPVGKCEQPPHSFRMVVAARKIAPIPPNDMSPRATDCVPAMNIIDEGGRTDQSRRAEIDFGHDQEQENAHDRERNDQVRAAICRSLFRERQTRRRGRKRPRSWPVPTVEMLCPASSIQRREPLIVLADRRDETKREQEDREREPDPPGPRPEVVVDQSPPRHK